MFFSVFTLGCKLNQLETEAITDSFCREGFCLVPWEPGSREPCSMEPGLMLINTCTVTSMAEQKARRIIRKVLREHPRACLIVTGCYAQMAPGLACEIRDNTEGAPDLQRLFVIPGEKKDRILDLPRFLAGVQICSPDTPDENVNRLPELISSWIRLNCQEPLFREQTGGESTGVGVFRFRPKRFSSHSRAFIKIQDGCDRRCAYCRVSLARGKNRSLGAGEALEELISLEQCGFAEAVLTGVNISRYCDAEGSPALQPDSGRTRPAFTARGLPGLLVFLLNGTERIRLRLSSIEPEPGGLSDEFIRVLEGFETWREQR